ncbi:uncharacterized protein [Chelonus insularis]|uniref:uncharacterized protein n=1 Tax=Chelonus insularis TaxID=460826 RepID=UPI00158A220E|nr:uncharacterized protein LOC118068547 [Chelonus insularis]XP_034941914.1 uncharacterized protein LOC118068547 [Chelonus insularis]
MPYIKKFGIIRRPGVWKLRNQLKRKPRPAASRNALYEKIKANNNNLATALSKEKQEKQEYFKQCVALESKVQEQEVCLNRFKEICKQIERTSKENLKVMYQLMTAITENTSSIVSVCQQITDKRPVSSPRYSISTSDSKRQSVTTKSPARGVVQPMVSGHTITKPVINLSRINMPGVQISPNLSDIDEEVTPESSPVRSTIQTTPVAINQESRFTHRRAERLLPERIIVTPTDDERESLLRQRSKRSSSKYSRRRSSNSSRSESFESRFSGNFNETIRNPTVALHDVSKLLQNSQSVNVRTFLQSTGNSDSGNELLASLDNNETNHELNSTNELDNKSDDKMNAEISVEKTASIIKSFQNIDDDESDVTLTFHRHPRKNKKENTSNNIDDPLEGPSWLHDSRATESNSTSLLENTVRHTEYEGWLFEKSIQLEKNVEATAQKKSLGNKTPNEEISDDDDGEVCRVFNMNEYKTYLKTINKKTDDEHSEPDIVSRSANVTVSRGRPVTIDDDDFTMCFIKKPNPVSNGLAFDLNELQLPQLERPLVQLKPPEPEPEITTTIKIVPPNAEMLSNNRLSSENFRLSPMQPNNSVFIPMIQESMRMSGLDSTDSPEENNQSTEDSNSTEVVLKKRNRRPRELSSSDSEYSNTPGKNIVLKKKIFKKKDPRSAKVVLEKLDENRRTSNEFRECLEPQSDSDNSNTSIKLSHRPKRRKAPVTLKEPSLRAKLRRK